MQNTPPVNFLKIDEMGQRILLILIAVTLIIYPIAMLLAIPFGVWQVISGIVGAIKGSKWRRIYLGIVALYFLSMPITANSSRVIMDSYVLEEIIIGFYFIIPMILGIFYYYKTRKELPKDEELIRRDDMDILDAEFVNVIE